MIAFRAYDKDQDGYCSWEEVWKRAQISKKRESTTATPVAPTTNSSSQITSNMEYDQYSRTVKALFDAQSKVNTGYLNFNEFRKLYVEVRPATQMDPNDTR